MTPTEFWDWIWFNKVPIGAILTFIIFLSYRHYKNKKIKKQAETQTEEIKETPKEEPVDLSDLDKKFLDVEIMENNNIQHLKDLRNETNEEIKTLKDDYKKRKKEFIDLLKGEKRLRIHIQTLIKQEEIYSEQIKKLEKG